ncbi:MAG TPA: helix-turn-helix domain-containing protein, partial [Longimicrobiaceae bacterium]|nr:helix-turn-helix domain-containing protein [Longimicrobiaceae bacterium]
METDARTADLILDAAETLFARQGFTATTIKQIGSAAGVNPALIYYHFGNKEALYRELLGRLFGTIVTQGGGLLDGEMRPDAAVRGLVEMQSAV